MVSYVTTFNPRSVSERDSNPIETLYNITNQVKGRSLTCSCRHRGGVGLYLYSYLTSAVNGVGGQRHALETLTPRKGHDTHGTVQETGWAIESVWTGVESRKSLTRTGFRTQNRLLGRESLSRLRHLVHHIQHEPM